jgi:membrane protease subunit HflK
VQTDEQGVVLRFGKYVRTTQPGLNYHLPAPIESVLTPKVTREQQVDIGFRSASDFGRPTASRDVLEEALMLTGDENIVDINFAVVWRIKDAGDFLFRIQQPAATVKAVAESVMREIVGRSKIDDVLTEGRALVESDSLDLIQATLDSYGAGIAVVRVQMQKADPPAAVIDAFRDVQRARADQERLRNEAQAYANDIIPRARGEAEQNRLEAEGYRERVVADAQGEASRYLSILQEYQQAPDVTRRRMYLEIMEQIYRNADKVILDTERGSGVVPYLPLPEIQRRLPGQRTAPGQGGSNQQ